jgi:phage-related protein
MQISYYLTAHGNSPVEKYLESLDDHESALILGALKDIQANGLEKADVQLRAIQGKLWELKIDRHRIFYILITGPVMVFLHACKKQGQKARKKDLDLAKARMKEVLAGE